MKQPYVIVIAHQKGGVGKSTIAANLAVELSKKVDLHVVDLDTQRSLSYFNGLRENNRAKSFTVLTVNSSEDLKNLINNNRKVLLIDLGGFDSDINRIAILGSDLIITPVSDSGVELVGLLAFRKILHDIRQHRPELIAHVLFNRIHPNATSSLAKITEFIKENAEFDLLDSVLRDRVEYKHAFDAGKSVVELKGKASKEMRALIKEIING